MCLLDCATESLMRRYVVHKLTTMEGSAQEDERSSLVWTPSSATSCHWTRAGGRPLFGMESKTTGVNGATSTYALAWKLRRPSSLPRSYRGTPTWTLSEVKVTATDPAATKHDICAAQEAGSALVISAWLVAAATSML